MIQYLQDILDKLMKGDISVLCPDNIITISEEAKRLVEKKEELDKYDVLCTNLIVSISQIVYNNTDKTLLFLDDGMYDLLLEKCKEYNPEYQVGAPVVNFDPTGGVQMSNETGLRYPVTFLPNAESFVSDAMFYDDITVTPPVDPELCKSYKVIDDAPSINTKRNVSIPHNYPKLVGSLDKYKFVLDREAKDRGVYDDPTVKIFERDFLAKHMQMGLFTLQDQIELVLELKYDGVSVEADVTNKILSARSRGDANADLAADMTPIFKDYVFPYAPEIVDSFGMKFEAIITKLNMEILASYGKVYKNARNAIIGILSSLDGPMYRNFITLVPLATSLDLDRIAEISFMNQYYNSGEYLRCAVIQGNYHQILYQVYRFVQEAEAMRCIMPFMYDGVVVSYIDPHIIEALGRKNSINKYSAAIKFNPLKREAVFTGYSYTVGQNGTITPMIHYTPVEFYGQIHDKSSGHSYARFKDLNLAYGDILNIEYTNDVMPYVTKADVQQNYNNTNSPIPFITHCPACDSQLVATDSGKKMMCPNRDCSARVLARVVSMVDKLNIKDFGEERLAALGVTGFKDLCDLIGKSDQLAGIIGEANSNKLIQVITDLLSKPIFDYQIVGSIGFSDIAVMTWKKILNKVELTAILLQGEEVLRDRLVNIHGIGRATAETIITERSIFKEDLEFILTMQNVIHTYGMVDDKKSIRFTGVRDIELESYLQSKGYDASGSLGLTKTTDILIVPYEGFSSTKTAKASPNTVIVPLEQFKANMDKYLNG